MLSKIGSGLFVSLPKFISMPQLLMQVFGSLLTIGCIVVMQDFQSFAIQNLTTGVVEKNIAELPAAQLLQLQDSVRIHSCMSSLKFTTHLAPLPGCTQSPRCS